jgi:hypothetical protein
MENNKKEPAPLFDLQGWFRVPEWGSETSECEPIIVKVCYQVWSVLSVAAKDRQIVEICSSLVALAIVVARHCLRHFKEVNFACAGGIEPWWGYPAQFLAEKLSFGTLHEFSSCK